MFKRVTAVIISLAILFVMVGQPVLADADLYIADSNDYLFRVLELAPSSSDFVLSDSDFSGKNVKLYQYAVKEYNAIREDMLGKYDLVYISNGNDDDEKYTTLGAAVNKIPAGDKPNGSKLSNYYNEYIYEYWPGNDATELLLGYLQVMLNQNQIIVADKKLEDFADGAARINKFVQDNSGLSNMLIENKSQATNKIVDFMTTDTYKAVGTLRPYLNLTSKPVEYDGSDTSYINTNSGAILEFKYDAMSYTQDTTFDVKLYFDINGDNKFKASDNELIKTRTAISAHDNLNFNLSIPEDFKGLQPYKFEIKDNLTGLTTYQTGYLAFRCNDPIEVNVLQVTPDNSTFNLKNDLKDENGNSLLDGFADDYLIDVDVIKMSELKSLYNDDEDFELVNYKGSGNDKAYNMIVFGFADVYGHADITDPYMASDLKKFINTGQSVMFTHDNLTFHVEQSGGWSRGLTKYFRDFVGQDIYSDGVMPKVGYTTLGFSEMAFDRANGMSYATTTTVYAANDGIMTQYPYVTVGGNESDFYDTTFNERKMTVAETHYQYYQLDLNNEDVVVWYTLAGNSRNDYHDPANYYYTYSIGNVTYSGTGHSNLKNANSFDERRLFVNTIIKAIRGANFAPEIDVQGVTDGDKIARSTDKLHFDLTAKDPDIEDRYLDGTIYLDKNGDGSYTSDEIVKSYNRTQENPGETQALESGISRAVELDLSAIGGTVAMVRFKVVVKDQMGASASKTYEFPLVDSPTITIDLNAPRGVLVGDTTTISTSAIYDVPALSIETRIKNIVLETGIQDGDNTVTDMPMGDTSYYKVDNYASNYTVLGNHLNRTIADITALTPGTSNQAIGSWSYDLTAKAEYEHDFILRSHMDYRLDVYADDEEKTVLQSFEIKKGKIGISLADDFGAPVGKTLATELYRFDTVAAIGDLDNPTYANGDKVEDVLIGDDSVIVGDDADEVLPTGYYILRVLGSEGFVETPSDYVHLNVDNPTETLDVVVMSEPLTGLKWVHSSAIDYPGMLKILKGTEDSDSVMMFGTYKEYESFELTFVDNTVTKMTMNHPTIMYTPDGGVAENYDSHFTYDAVTNKIVWSTAGTKMPEGQYVIMFQHHFTSDAQPGHAVEYQLKDVVVEIYDLTSGTNVEKTYTPESIDAGKLRFLKSVDIL